MIQKYALICLAFFAFIASGLGQVTIYNENMYNGTGGASGNSIAVHETNNRFNEDGLTYSGTGDMRNTTFSSGYAGASGTWNAMINANTETFIMDGIDVSLYSDIVLSFGVKKSTTAENGSSLIVEYSTTGATGSFSSLSWGSLPTGTGTATPWYLMSGISIPSGTTTIRFTGTNTVEWRIDDIRLVGELASTTYSVTYNGNGSDGGTAPTDATAYDSGDTVTVLNTGNLTRDGYYFTGWNTAANGSGASYLPGATFTITADATLYAQWTEIPYDSCLSVDFDDDFGNLPGGFISTGGANTDPDFYISASYSRSLTSTQTLRTPPMARPAAIEFYAIGSGAGGQLLTLEYTNNGTNWFPLTTYNVSAAGATFYYDSSATTSAEPVAAYRITSGANTIYIDDLTVYCTCDLTASGIADIACDDNGTGATAADDFITFELDPTVLSSSTVYNVSVSSGTITPNMNIAYGGPTTFTLQGGSAGGGNVTVTITDGISGGCELDVVITDPGSCSVSTVDWCNVQFPTASPQTITEGDNFDVYAQVYEPGVTDTPFAQGANITAWIGYSLTNTNPNTAGWTWVPAAYNNIGGNNDEYVAEIGSGLDPGTYYYASRFQLNGSTFVYGGTGGIWNNDSVQLNVIADQVDFCNVDFPKTATITQGDNFTVFAHAYEPAVTEAAGQGANIVAWIGYTTVGINHEPWQATGWTWVLATYDSDFANNDNYRAQIGSTLGVGTYYYASRFRLNGSSTYSYGGIQANNNGNFWSTGVYNNGTLTVNTPPLADVVITEIMYNPGGTDDEWIEICNVSGSTQNLSSYTVRLGGTTRFTFPIGTTILDGQCITVSLGSNGDGTYNNPCPFVPDFGIGASTTNTNILPNGAGPYTITLVAANGTDIADTVVYGSGDGANGNNSTLHVTNILLDNSDAGTNWQEVLTGGSPGVNSLVSPCSVPELQLVDSSNTDQPCGTFTIDFGSQATGFNTDLTFDIDNDGSSGLTISSFNITGTNFGDFTIVSPATPFTINAGNSQTVTVRFTPTAIGVRTATLTINNNDANEGACSVLLTGNGTSPAPNIRVERNTEALIANGAAANVGNNTVFATTDLGDTTAPKLYYVRNGNTANPATADLTVNTIASSNNAEFTLVNVPALPVTLTPGQFITFEIEFSPNSTTPLTRTSTITVTSSDTTDNPYTFGVEGTAGCPVYNGTITPTSGPVGTEITITSAENLTGATATLNGVPLTTVSSTTSELIVQVPLTVTLGGALTVQLSNGCSFTNTFTLIDEAIQSCEGSGSTPTGLFISQLTDSPTGSLTYIELYNATGSNINFAVTNYALRVYNNGSTTSFNTIPLTSGIINQNSTYVVAIGTGDSQCAVSGGNGSLAQLTVSTPGVSINFHRSDDVMLGHDFIGLYNSSSTLIDAFGAFGNETWAVGLNLDTSGANFIRNADATLPNTTFSVNDWDIIDWENCAGVDYSDIGAYDFSVGTPPTVDLLLAPTSDCNLSATLTVTGTEGFNGGGDTQELAYQWYYSAPGEIGWTEVPDNAVYDGVNTDTLEILNTLTLDGYQYYCQIREDDATCYTASNAIKLNVDATVWTAGAWSAGLPTINRIAIIDDNYITNAGGQQTSFSACNLLVRTGRLTIADNTFVEVENNVTVESEIYVNERGSFKQNNNNGDVTVSGTVLVRKETAPMNNWYEYTYWSSPVAGETVGNALNDATPSRRFWFNAQNFLDESAETGNNNAVVDGQDDIDDNDNDWTLTDPGDTMIPGRGYASTHRSNIFSSTPGPLPHQFVYTFDGPFNNGIYNVPVYRNDLETQDINWNFIGNPYPSAIWANAFLTANTLLDTNVPTPGFIDGAIYLWSQNTAPADDANGNEALNFAQADYAIINGTAQSAGGDGVMPTRYIPSGQGFFVSLSDAAATTVVSGTIRTANVVFNNQMRVTGNNNQFFRTSEELQPNKLWVNLTSDNGVFNQIVVGYVDGATDAYDGMYYDAPRNLSTDANSILYTIIPDSNKKLAIQGKEPNGLTLDEVIPLGFYTSINQATIYKLSIAQFEGDFFSNQTVYVKDNLLNLYHDLSAADYPFTSEIGEFNERFEIVFQTQTLGVGEVDLHPNDISIIELNNGHVKFTVGHNLTIQSVEIFDMLGRQLYNLPASNAIEVYNLANLSQAAYVAKVTLSNGQTVTKRAVKRQ